MLTAMQRRAFVAIEAGLREHGVAPSRDELQGVLGQASKSSCQRLVNALVDKGYLRRLPYRARALEIVRRPESATAESATAADRAAGAVMALDDVQGLALARVIVARAEDPAALPDLIRLRDSAIAAIARLIPPAPEARP